MIEATTGETTYREKCQYGIGSYLETQLNMHQTLIGFSIGIKDKEAMCFLNKEQVDKLIDNLIKLKEKIR